MTTLPEGYSDLDRSIASMDEGESAWTVPWAMYHDRQRKLWLNGSYTTHPRAGGTASMLVRRDIHGWHVDASACEEQRWHLASYAGDFPAVAVASLKL